MGAIPCTRPDPCISTATWETPHRICESLKLRTSARPCAKGIEQADRNEFVEGTRRRRTGIEIRQRQPNRKTAVWAMRFGSVLTRWAPERK